MKELIVQSSKDIESLKEHLKSSPAFIKFFSPYCGYCHMMQPEWIKMKNTLKNNYNDNLIVVDIPPEFMNELDVEINGFPTMVAMGPQHYKHHFQGNRSSEDFVNFLSSIGYTKREKKVKSKKTTRSRKTSKSSKASKASKKTTRSKKACKSSKKTTRSKSASKKTIRKN
uniref:Thioredoxin domain-containing protein n=1 Tax=viral metagenome TaxID=1070528 RepID=A0A6C0KDW0_9ZZZZ